MSEDAPNRHGKPVSVEQTERRSSDATEGSARAADAQRPRAWALVAMPVFAMAWGGNHFTPLLVLYREQIGYSQTQVYGLLAAYLLGLVPGFLSGGPISDLVGRRLIAQVAMGLGLVASVVLALGAHHVTILLGGRVLSGLSVALAMVVGTAWIKELSAGAAKPMTTARRASLTLTGGFVAGAVASGLVAQYLPAPTILPYALHIAVSLVATVGLVLASDPPRPERQRTEAAGRRGSVPPGQHFWAMALPTAVWVFSAPALALRWHRRCCRRALSRTTGWCWRPC